MSEETCFEHPELCNDPCQDARSPTGWVVCGHCVVKIEGAS